MFLRNKISELSKKGDFHLLFIVVTALLILPLTVFLVQKQIEHRNSGASKGTDLEGTLYVYIADDFDGAKSSTHYKLKKTDGTLVDLEYKGSSQLKTGSYVKLSGVQTTTSTMTVDESSGGSLTVLAQPQVTSISTGTKKVAVILMNFDSPNRLPLTEPTQAQAQDFFSTTIRNYFKEVSYNKLDTIFDVYGWYSYRDINCLTYTNDILFDGVALANELGINLTNYNNLLLIVPPHRCPNDGTRGYALTGEFPTPTPNGVVNLGLAWVDGSLWTNNILGHPVTHELGHNFGFQHANGYDCDNYFFEGNCQSFEYSDYWEPMGAYYHAMKHYNGYRKAVAGWLTGSELLSVDPAQVVPGTEFVIAPIESSQSLYPKTLAIKRGSDSYFYVDNRRLIGFDSGLPTQLTNGAVVYVAPFWLSNGDTQTIDFTPKSREGSEDFSDYALRKNSSFWDNTSGVVLTFISKDSNGNMKVSLGSPVKIDSPNALDGVIYVPGQSGGLDLVGYVDGDRNSYAYNIEQYVYWTTGNSTAIKFERANSEGMCSPDTVSCFGTPGYYSWNKTFSIDSQGLGYTFNWRINAKNVTTGVVKSSAWRKIRIMPNSQVSTTPTPTQTPVLTATPTFTPTPTPIPVSNVPTQLLPVNGELHSNTLPVFDWSDVANRTGYQLQVAKDTLFTSTSRVLNVSPTNSTYSATTALTKGTSYYWRVRTKLVSGNSDWSEVWNFRVSNPPTIPGLVSPGNGSLVKTTTPLFDWNASSRSPVNYQIQIDDNSDFSSTIIDTTVPSTQTSYYPTLSLPTVNRYYWRVRAVNTYDEYSNWSSVWNVKIAPDTPVLTSPIGGVTTTSRKPTFNWNSVSNASGYRLQISLYSDFSILAVDNNTLTTNTFTPGTNLGSNKLYYWRVLSKSSLGNSNWSRSTFRTPQ